MSSEPRFEKLIKENIDGLFKIIADNLKSETKEFEKLKEDTQDSINAKIEFMKESIEIKIESIKIELDQLKEKLYDEVDKYKGDLNKRVAYFNETIWSTEVDAIERDISKKCDLNEALLYDYERKLFQLREQLAELRCFDTNIEFEESQFKIDTDIIGRLKYVEELMLEGLIERSKRQKCEKITFENANTSDARCFNVLRNGCIVFLNYDGLFLYSGNFKLIKELSSVDVLNLIHEPIKSIDSNKDNEIYISTFKRIYKLTSGLEIIDSTDKKVKFDGAITLFGICCHDDVVYACDLMNNCIYEFESNLSLKRKHMIPFAPRAVQIINNVACVLYLLENKFVFYRTNDFSIIKDYGFPGEQVIVGVFYSYFLIYNDTKMYCYDANGTFIKTFEVNLKLNTFDVNSNLKRDYKLCQYKNKLIFCLEDGLGTI